LLLVQHARPKRLFHACRHAGPRFARPDYGNSANAGKRQLLDAHDQAVPFDAQVFADEPVAADGIDRRMPNGESVISEAGR
jgi:hypothetical protein